ncbi:MAG: hypothetical protein K6G25_06230 [Bacteroidales bacterium]|nr:hypothetical protein [Bacteroidales bacterium]
MLEIFKTRKAMKAEIEELNQQIAIQSREMEKLRSANTHLNDLLKNSEDKRKTMEPELEGAKKAQTDLIEENNKLRKELGTLKDTNSGLASSVSELKAKLSSKEAKLKADNVRISRLKAEIEKLKKGGKK